jgi:hypothetical protein
MTRFSNPTSISIVNPSVGKGALGILAAQMSPGQSMYLGQAGTGTSVPTDYFRGVPMDGTTLVSQSQTVGSVIVQNARAVYDPIRNKIWVNGGNHGDVLSGVVFLLEYDMATNNWFKMDMGQSTVGAAAGNHGWEHMAVHPATGDLYKRGYNYGPGYTLRMYKRTFAGHTTPPAAGWADTTLWPQMTFTTDPQNVTASGSLDWVPFMNGGVGALVASSQTVYCISNAAMTTFTNYGVADDIGKLDTISVVTDNYYYFGGGSGNPNPSVFYRVDSTGSSTRLVTNNIPFNPGAYGQPAAPHAHPNGVDFVMFPQGLIGPVSRYTAATNTWTTLFTLNPNDPVYNGIDAVTTTYHVCATLKDLGVILILHSNNFGAGAFVRMSLYKPPA